MLPPTRDGTARTRWLVACVWQLPTALFAVSLVPLLLTSPGDVDRIRSLLAGLGVIGLATALAFLVPWERVGYAHRVGVPLLDLVGAALIYDCTHLVLPPSLLLVVLPVVWLSSELDLVGLALGTVGAFGVAVTPTLTSLGAPDTVTAWINIALPPTSCFCLGLLALAVTRILVAARTAMERHTVDLDLRIATLHGVLKSVDAGIGVFLPGEPPLCNQQALDLAALGGIDPETHGPGDRIFAADGHTPVPAYDQVLARATRGEAWTGLLQWVGPAGHQVAMVSSCHQMVDDDGGHRGTVLVGFDATAFIDSVRVREEFLTTVSHELRTPLTSVIGYLELLDDELAADTGRDVTPLVTVVRRNADVLLARIDQLLEVAPGGGGELDLQEVDVSTLTQAALDKHRVLADRSAIDLRAVVGAGLVSVVDVTAYEQVVDNLVTNAIKYTRQHGTVTVALEVSEQVVVGSVPPPAVVLRVADTGVGMSPDECHRAFDRFYRSPFANTQAIPGLGIGLAITRRLVRQHGGDIALESRPGIGTAVTVVLPVMPAAVARHEQVGRR